MAGNMKVSMTLTATDQASKVIQKGQAEAAKAASDTAKAVARTNNEQQKSTQQAARSARTAAEEYRRAAAAREALGVRSERTIQREIAQTTAAYNRLARAGVMSAREQDRAFRAMKDRVRELRQEMGGLSRISLGGLGRGAGAAVGGAAAGGVVLAQPVLGQMAYERTLSGMANTSFSKDGLAGRKAGRGKLETSIRNAVTAGGGTKEDAATAMSTMLNNGTDFDTANKWLPDIMKYATATGASANDLAAVAISAKKSFGVKDSEIPELFNMAIAAGKTGSFELKDMARYLPGQFAFAGKEGMAGLNDFAALLSLNQAAGITAANSDEAGNNVINLLGKINSKEAATAAAGIDMGGYGIDLTNTLANAREKGINPIEAFNQVVNAVVGKNQRYQDLQKKLDATENGSERAVIMESMAKILEGGAIGEIIADRQALMAFLGYRNNPEYRKQVESTVNAQRDLPVGKRTGDEDFNFIATTNDYKLEHAKAQADFAQMDSVKKLADATGSAAETVSRLSQEFPGLTTAVSGATLAIQSMTAAAVAFAGIKLLTRGAGAAGTAATGAGTTAAGVAASKGGSLFGALGRIVGIGGAATGLATMTTPEEDAAVEGSEERWKRIRAKHPQSVIDAARKKYQPWYQFGEGYSTENEQWIEQYIKDQESSAKNAGVNPEQVLPGGASAAGDASQTASRNTVAPFPADGVQMPPMNVTTQVVLDSYVLAEALNRVNIMDGNRGTGGTQ